jgi:hypothetical protein
VVDFAAHAARKLPGREPLATRALLTKVPEHCLARGKPADLVIVATAAAAADGHAEGLGGERVVAAVVFVAVHGPVQERVARRGRVPITPAPIDPGGTRR